MFITINKDGSVYAQSSEFIAFYNDQGKLSCSVSGRNVPEFININDHREKKSPIPDKNESPVKPIKITVDSSDLDKLEAQLKRIERLMISIGLKEPASGGFVASPFFVENGQVSIKTNAIKEAALKVVTAEYAESGPLKNVIKTETEDQRRIKALETSLSSLGSSIASINQAMADSDRAFAASLERVHADIQSVKSGWQL
ncbi:hypothetical protein U7S25_000991 [Providencia rettgeri]|nr:hypothetical protein [Providencia rettgeri]